LLFDENLPPALARKLASSDVACAQVSSLNLIAAADLDIWSFAARESYIVVTKDKDFQQLPCCSDGPADCPLGHRQHVTCGDRGQHPRTP
jgi:predicted nuclease of predicted toxin-antitoxin system